MNTALNVSQTYTAPENLRASFWGLVKGEWFKLGRKWSTWIWLAFVALAVGGATYLLSSRGNGQAIFDQKPAEFYATFVFFGMDVARIVGGIGIIFIGASMFGMEYHGGPLRILLARGVGRIQLYMAKLLTMFFFSLLVLLVGFVALNLIVIFYALTHGSHFAIYTSLTGEYWSGFATLAGVQILNMLLTILLSFFFVLVTRSYAVGMTLAILWFPVDNIGSNILYMASRLTENDFWKNITGYLLGPNLNLSFTQHLSESMQMIASQTALSSVPAVEVAWQQNFWVIGAYAVLFLVVAVVLFVRRDVKE